MPGLNGYEVCRRLRADEANAILPVVMVTRASGRSRRRGSTPAPTTSSPSRSTRPSCSRGCARCCASSATTTRSGAGGRARRAEPHARAARATAVAQLERLRQLKRFFSPQLAERSSRGRRAISRATAARSRWSSSTCAASPLHRDRRAGGGDGRARRVPRRIGRLVHARGRSASSPATASWSSSTTRCDPRSGAARGADGLRDARGWRS